MALGIDGWAPNASGGPFSPEEWWPALGSAVVVNALPTAEALVVAVVALFVARRVRELVRRSLKRTRADPSVVLLLGRASYLTVLAFGAIWILAIYNVPPTALVAALGAVGLAVSLALQDVLKNLVAGLYLLVEKPFQLGDRLTVRAFDGIVESVDIRTTTLRVPTGERVLIPNAILFAEVLVNRGVPPTDADVESRKAEERDSPRRAVPGTG